MPSELRPVVKAFGLRREGDLGGFPVYVGRCGDVDVVATGTGIGPAKAAAATARLLEVHALDHVIVSGIAGGIEGAVAVGGLVVPTDVVDAATGERFQAT